MLLKILQSLSFYFHEINIYILLEYFKMIFPKVNKIATV